MTESICPPWAPAANFLSEVQRSSRKQVDPAPAPCPAVGGPGWTMRPPHGNLLAVRRPQTIILDEIDVTKQEVTNETNNKMLLFCSPFWTGSSRRDSSPAHSTFPPSYSLPYLTGILFPPPPPKAFNESSALVSPQFD